MSDRMVNAPVYYALAQAQFSPVTAMTKYIEEIQDRLRRIGYPLFEAQPVTQLVVPTPGQAQQAEPQITHTASWVITRGDRMAGFILGPTAITYHTTRYVTHKEFIPELIRGLAIVHEVAVLDHISRLGMRYLDAVLPAAGETVERYLVDGLRGIPFATTPRYALTETVFGTETGPLIRGGVLVTRIYKVTARLGFPPDLPLRGLILDPRFDTPEALAHAIIDTDHYVEGRMPVDGDKLAEQLVSLHAALKEILRAATTDHARGVWA